MVSASALVAKRMSKVFFGALIVATSRGPGTPTYLEYQEVTFSKVLQVQSFRKRVDFGFSIRLSHPSSYQVTVFFKTGVDDAMDDSDFQAHGGNVNFRTGRDRQSGLLEVASYEEGGKRRASMEFAVGRVASEAVQRRARPRSSGSVTVSRERHWESPLRWLQCAVPRRRSRSAKRASPRRGSDFGSPFRKGIKPDRS